MRILVTGSRDWPNAILIYRELNRALEANPDGITLVVGDCKTGADSMARGWANSRIKAGYAVSLKVFYADWNLLGKKAGPARNYRMVETNPDVCLAFILNRSRGATHCATAAADHDVRTYVWNDPHSPDYRQLIIPL